MMESDVGKSLSYIGIKIDHGISKLRKSVEVVCGEGPPETCLPLEAPCLFDIETDPCEYHNLASKEPELVQELLDLIQWYNSTAVPPLNTPADPLSNPKFWGYVYTNWADYLLIENKRKHTN